VSSANVRVSRVEITVSGESSTASHYWRVADHGGCLPKEAELGDLASRAMVRAIGQSRSAQLTVQYNTPLELGKHLSRPVDASTLRNGHALARLMREMVTECEETEGPQGVLHGWAPESCAAA
jgi:hypothetical protein